MVSQDSTVSLLHKLDELILGWVSPGIEAVGLRRKSNERRIGRTFVFPTPLMLRTEALGLGLDSNERRNGCSLVLPVLLLCSERLRLDRCLPRCGMCIQYVGVAAAKFSRKGVRRYQVRDCRPSHGQLTEKAKTPAYTLASAASCCTNASW